jgi:N6-adenosine-specific RNA methylase IME4
MNTEKKYQVIYADPPWHYNSNNYDRLLHKIKGGDGVNHKFDMECYKHYPTMTFEQLKAMPVPDIADKNCALFMWTTNAHLPEALEIIKAWGFTYRTIAFNWVKKYPNGNLRVLPGPWTNGGSEICLMGGKGNMKQFKKDPRVKQCLIQEVSKHSKKPQEIADRIVKLFPDVNRIELFARDAKPGWDVWGNEITNTIEL